MSAIQTHNRDDYYWQARRLAEERGCVDERDVPRLRAMLLHQDCQKEMEPWIRKLMGIHAVALPVTAIVNGRLERLSDGLTDELRAIAAQIEAEIARIKSRYEELARAPM